MIININGRLKKEGREFLCKEQGFGCFLFCFFATHEKVAINWSRSFKKKSNEMLFNQAIDEDFEKTKLLPRLKWG